MYHWDTKFENCMLDLGASTNVMPTSVYNNLDIGPLHNTGLTIQLTNISNVHPVGVVKDVLIQVNDLIFPVGFYILDMEGKTKSSRAPIILGRPFMKTAKTKFGVDDGTMSMEFGDIIAKFNIFDSMKHPMEEHSIFHIKLLYKLVNDTYSELLADFTTLSDFDDIYCCDACTDTHLCCIFAKIEASLHVDIFSAYEVVNEVIFAVEALDIPYAPTNRPLNTHLL